MEVIYRKESTVKRKKRKQDDAPEMLRREMAVGAARLISHFFDALERLDDKDFVRQYLVAVKPFMQASKEESGELADLLASQVAAAAHFGETTYLSQLAPLS